MATIGTWLSTLFGGTRVGEDEYGNRYYVARRPGKRLRQKRWVMYRGEVEASAVPPRWHAWLHHVTDALPADQDIPVRTWERPHQPNATGTEAAYRPAGHELAGGRRARGTGDYEPWTPS